MFTIKANDFCHPVDEADFGNNQRSVFMDTENAFFPNIKVNEGVRLDPLISNHVTLYII